MSILWGKDKGLDYWSALQADEVPAAERRAMGLLASLSDEKRFSFYCMSGMFPAMGNVTKRMYLVRRWTTVLELEDGRPKASWCILAQDRMIAPETDHVVAMKNILEGSEMHFREIGNAFHYSNDPFRGKVDPKTSFPNPYYNQIGPGNEGDAHDQWQMDDTAAGSMGPPRISVSRVRNQTRAAVEQAWNSDSALEFKERDGWVKSLRYKAEYQAETALAKAKRNGDHSAAAFRPWLLKEALLERAKDWVRIPPKQRYKLPPTRFEEIAENTQRALRNIGSVYGAGTAMTFTSDTNCNANVYVNNAGTGGNIYIHPTGHGPNIGQITIGGMLA